MTHPLRAKKAILTAFKVQQARLGFGMVELRHLLHQLETRPGGGAGLGAGGDDSRLSAGRFQVGRRCERSVTTARLRLPVDTATIRCYNVLYAERQVSSSEPKRASRFVMDRLPRVGRVDLAPTRSVSPVSELGSMALRI